MTLWLEANRCVAVLYSVVGDVRALDQALAHIRSADVDMLVFLGELVAGGEAEKTLERIDEARVTWPARFVLGRTDAHLIEQGHPSELTDLEARAGRGRGWRHSVRC